MNTQAIAVQPMAPMAIGLDRIEIVLRQGIESDAYQLSFGVPNQHGMIRAPATIRIQIHTGSSAWMASNKLFRFCAANSKKTTPVRPFANVLIVRHGDYTSTLSVMTSPLNTPCPQQLKVDDEDENVPIKGEREARLIYRVTVAAAAWFALLSNTSGPFRSDHLKWRSTSFFAIDRIHLSEHRPTFT